MDLVCRVEGAPPALVSLVRGASAAREEKEVGSPVQEDSSRSDSNATVVVHSESDSEEGSYGFDGEAQTIPATAVEHDVVLTAKQFNKLQKESYRLADENKVLKAELAKARAELKEQAIAARRSSSSWLDIGW